MFEEKEEVELNFRKIVKNLVDNGWEIYEHHDSWISPKQVKAGKFDELLVSKTTNEAYKEMILEKLASTWKLNKFTERLNDVQTNGGDVELYKNELVFKTITLVFTDLNETVRDPTMLMLIIVFTNMINKYIV